MVDPFAVSTSVVGGALILKLLGPSADLLGHGLREFLHEKGQKTVTRILNNSLQKTERSVDEPGGVSPRVFKSILLEGAFNDDEISIEYYGIIIAASRNKEADDDRAIPFLKVIEQLSSFQLRAHCFFYRAIHHRLREKNKLKLPKLDDLNCCFFFDMADFISNVSGKQSSDKEQQQIILDHCLFGLQKKGLIKIFAYGDPETLKNAVVWGRLVPGWQNFHRSGILFFGQNLEHS